VTAMSDTARYSFRIPIGDWSNDGHGQVEWYYATASKPIEAVRKAWASATVKMPALSPEHFCDTYQDREIPEDVAIALRAAGAPLREDLENFDADGMSNVVVWFLNQGDSELDVRLDGEATPMLRVSVGYGLFD